MRMVLPWVMICAGVIACAGILACAGEQTGPLSVPDPQQVSTDDIPQPFTEQFYFRFGWDQQEGPDAILQNLLNEGFLVRYAWVPDPEEPSPCLLFVQLTQLIVELERPNARMLDLGFTQDASNVVLGPCNPFWLEYDFEPKGGRIMR